MHDLFLQNFLKAFVAIDPISLIPILTIITQGLNTKKTIKLSGFDLFLPNIFMFGP